MKTIRYTIAALGILIMFLSISTSYAASKKVSAKGAGLFQLSSGEIELKPLEQGALNAVNNSDAAALELILSKGVSPNLIIDIYGNTLLSRLFENWSAYDSKRILVFDTLMKAGANLNIANKKGITPAYIAAVNYYIPLQVLEALKSKGANFSAAPKCTKQEKECIPNTTPLLLIAKNPSMHSFIVPSNNINYIQNVVEHFDYLLLNGNINAGDGTGQTALHYAAVKGYHNVIKSMLEAGADARKKDKRGITPEDLILKSGRSELIGLLR